MFDERKAMHIHACDSLTSYIYRAPTTQALFTGNNRLNEWLPALLHLFDLWTPDEKGPRLAPASVVPTYACIYRKRNIKQKRAYLPTVKKGIPRTM